LLQLKGSISYNNLKDFDLMADKINNENGTLVNDNSTQPKNVTPVNDGSTPQQNVVLIPTTSYAKQFPDVTKIEEFDGQNFKRWQDHVHSILDMYSVANALTEPKPASTATEKVIEQWTHANRVCRCTILSTLSNDLFDVYCAYKEAKDI
jgi:hypothetical protein